MYNLSVITSKENLFRLLLEGLKEIFIPVQFSFKTLKEDLPGEFIEIRTHSSSFGYIHLSGMNISDSDLLLVRNAIQMVALFAEKLESVESMKRERNEFEELANQKIKELEIAVAELLETRSATLNIIEDLNLEIEKRSKVERELIESQARIEAFMNYVPAVILIKDSELRPVYGNSRFREMFPADEWMGKKPGETFPPEVAEMMIAKDLEALEKGYTTYNEEWNDLAGKKHVFNTQKFRIDLPGTEVLLGAIISDITDRIDAEISLRESEEKFRNLFENSPIGKSLTRIDGTINVNKKFCDILGYTHEELAKKNWQDISHPDDLLISESYVTPLMEGREECVSFEKRYIHKNGFVVQAELTIYLQRDKSGNPEYFITTVRDITEIKKMEKERYRLLGIIENSLNEIYTFDSETLKFEYANLGARKNIGFSMEELRKITPVDIKPLISESQFLEMVRPLKNGSQSILKFETVHRRKNGSDYPVDVNLQFYRESEGGLFVAFIDDISVRKRAEEAIINLNEELESRVNLRTAQLEAVNKELEAFSYSVSHDLRAPLRAIHSFTKILQEEYSGNLDKEGQRICGVIETSSVRMGNLIDDLLAFSRLGRSSINFSKINMSKLVNEVYNETVTEHDKKKLSFSIGDLPSAYGDPNLIKIVFTNLISNAVKYSSRNVSPVVTVSAQNSEGKVIYQVKDNGVGFDMLYSSKLFGVFQRLHSTKDFEGNGVGLAIVYRIITRHGGKVWGESKLNEGATFNFTLPPEPVKQSNIRKDVF